MLRWLSERKQLTATTPLATLALGLPAAAACCRLTELPAWCWAYCALSQLPHRMWNVESWSVGCLSNPPTPAMDHAIHAIHATDHGWHHITAVRHLQLQCVSAVQQPRQQKHPVGFRAAARVIWPGQARPGMSACCGCVLRAAVARSRTATKDREAGDWRLAMDNAAGFVSAANDKSAGFDQSASFLFHMA